MLLFLLTNKISKERKDKCKSENINKKEMSKQK